MCVDHILIFSIFFCNSKQERESKIILCDSQKKYEEMFRRLGVMEEELKRAEEVVEKITRVWTGS